MAHKNRRSPPRRWSPEPRHSFKPAKEPSRRGISVSWPFNVVGSFPSRGAPSLPLPRRRLAAFCRQIHSLASPRGDGSLRRRSSRVVDGGDPPMIHYASRGRLVCVIRALLGEWPRGGREICEELGSKDEV